MTIKIRELAFEAIIGILDFERKAPQRVIAECQIDYDGEFVDYAVVRELIIYLMQQKCFGLIEEALSEIIAAIKARYPQITRITLEIAKPDILPDCTVSVTESVAF